MSDHVIWLGIGAFVLAFIALIAWSGRPDSEHLYCSNGTLTKKTNRKEESIELSSLSKINYHYHAVIGFTGVWEFIDKHGTTLTADGEMSGIEEALSYLEKVLPNFSLIEFKKKFDAGDAEDTIDVWENT